MKEWPMQRVELGPNTLLALVTAIAYAPVAAREGTDPRWVIDLAAISEAARPEATDAYARAEKAEEKLKAIAFAFQVEGVDLAAEARALKAKVKELEAALTEAQGRVKELEIEMLQWRQKAWDNAARAEKAEDLAKTRDETSDALSRECVAWRDRATKAEADNHAHLSGFNRMAEECAGVRDALAKAEARTKELEASWDALKAHTDRMVVRNQNLVARAEKAEAKVKELEAQLEEVIDLAAIPETAKPEAETLEPMLDARHTDPRINPALHAAITRAEKAEAAAQHELQRADLLEKRLREFEAQFDRDQARIKELEDERERLQKYGAFQLEEVRVAKVREEKANRLHDELCNLINRHAKALGLTAHESWDGNAAYWLGRIYAEVQDLRAALEPKP